MNDFQMYEEGSKEAELIINVLERVKQRLKDRTSHCICLAIYDVYVEDGKIVHSEHNLVRDWFVSQKPTPSLHTKFYKGKYFTGTTLWWNDIDDFSNHSDKLYDIRIKFIDHILKLLKQ